MVVGFICHVVQGFALLDADKISGLGLLAALSGWLQCSADVLLALCN